MSIPRESSLVSADIFPSLNPGNSWLKQLPILRYFSTLAFFPRRTPYDKKVCSKKKPIVSHFFMIVNIVVEFDWNNQPYQTIFWWSEIYFWSASRRLIPKYLNEKLCWGYVTRLYLFFISWIFLSFTGLLPSLSWMNPLFLLVSAAYRIRLKFSVVPEKKKIPIAVAK